MTLLEMQTKCNKARGVYEATVEQKTEQDAAKVKCEKREIDIEQTQVLIQRTAQQTQEQLRFHIEDIVRSSIEAVFPDTYDFTVEFEIKRNKTEANLKFTKNGHEIDIMDSSGGGLVDTASLGLRLAAWSLGNSNNVLILDESLKFLSKDLQPRMGEILQELSKKLGLQMIAVSHSEALIESADAIFVVKQVDKVSSVSIK